MPITTVHHRFEITPKDFWARVFFDEEYNRRLYVDVLRFKHFSIVEFDQPEDGAIRRRIEMEPSQQLPEAVKKIVGSSFRYTEEGRFDTARQRWVYRIIPSAAADKVRIGGEYWVEERGPKEIERFCTTDVSVNVFLVGKVIEGIIGEQTREQYEHVARFTADFIREKGL